MLSGLLWDCHLYGAQSSRKPQTNQIVRDSACCLHALLLFSASARLSHHDVFGAVLCAWTLRSSIHRHVGSTWQG